MNDTLLITRPNHDITTNYLFYWSGKIIDEADKKHLKIIDLKSKRANKEQFTKIINKTSPSIVILNGHGDNKSVFGFDNKDLISSGINESLLKTTITYAVSCSSAKDLGPACVRHGAKAYIGYTDDFTFMIDESKIAKPLEDNTAKLFLEPSNQVGISLVKGNDARTAYEKSQESFRRNIRSLLTSESTSEEKETLPFLLWDMRHQVCLE
ncbi:hypothetical protein HY008_02530 [Candidatus Woesebacteria bacterium]|nr:hypothetical protein [Candidatus Woesebacteria bacterium]